MNTLDTPIKELLVSIRTSNSLIRNNVKTIRDLLNTDIKIIATYRNVGVKTISEILDLYERLKEEHQEEYECERIGYLYWKAKHDSYNYGILLKDGTVIHAKELIEKEFGWIDILIEKEQYNDFLPFGKLPVKFTGCRDRISLRKEFIAAICEIES